MPLPNEIPANAWIFLTRAEARFIDAAVSRLIPADQLGPGAREANVTCFIDRQLASGWGSASRMYRLGPWQDGTPQQGNQSRLTPQEVYRHGIRETNLHCMSAHDRNFDVLPTETQDAILSALQEGSIELPSLGSKKFFNLLWRNTEEGFFADPLYGGNRDKIGWKLVGFPGVAAANYADLIGQHGEPYRVVEPVSILDIEEGRVPVDAQGSPRHVKVSVVVKPAGAEK
jgi:gluconate 2-dehydrogenase gamma chain